MTRVLSFALALTCVAQAGIDQEGCAPVGAVSVVVEPVAGDQLTRELLLEPGTVPRPGLASPTRVPWVNSNGSRILRRRGAKHRYELPDGKGTLAAAEAVAYNGDALLHVAPGDLPAVCRVFAFVKDVPPAALPDIADIGVVDDGSAAAGEVMNLLVRRNLLFKAVAAPDPRLPVNVVLGSPEYPVSDVADPSALALKVRRQLSDERRALRIFGSEVVIARLTGDAGRARLHLLNYGSREITGLRIRVRGTYATGEAYVFDRGRVALTDYAAADGVTEFSLPVLTVYAIIDLR